ncbi:hypothetical protein H4R35_006759 [Dimargaris xerosporica]|nr:hypothetical protein H4R35_006759 [Dimargaris xerosporica]
MAESIVFCIDVDREMDCELSGAATMGPGSRIALTKRLLKTFIEAKQRIGPNLGHRFALVLLKDRAEWVMDFSSDCALLGAVIDELGTTGNYRQFDTSSLFSVIASNTRRLAVDKIPRVICIYGRSDVVPAAAPQHLRAHVASPLFTFDLVYLHHRRTAQWNPQIIYDFWTALESALAPGYFFEITKSSRRLAQAMVKLLANPQMRPRQLDCDYTIQAA